MSGKTFYRVHYSFARFNAKHSVDFADRPSAKSAALRALEEGIWVRDSETQETYWGPVSIAKVTIETVRPDND